MSKQMPDQHSPGRNDQTLVRKQWDTIRIEPINIDNLRSKGAIMNWIAYSIYFLIFIFTTSELFGYSKFFIRVIPHIKGAKASIFKKDKIEQVFVFSHIIESITIVHKSLGDIISQSRMKKITSKITIHLKNILGEDINDFSTSADEWLLILKDCKVYPTMSIKFKNKLIYQINT